MDNMKNKVKITPEMMRIYNLVRYHLYLKPYRQRRKQRKNLSTLGTIQK